MAYFGSSQEEEDLEEDEEQEEEEVRNGGGVPSLSGASSSQASASSSCHSTPRKGRLPARQPLNGHGKAGTMHAMFTAAAHWSRLHTLDVVSPTWSEKSMSLHRHSYSFSVPSPKKLTSTRVPIVGCMKPP